MKTYVDVLVRVSRDGGMRPLALKNAQGRTVAIDRVTDCRRAASLKAGGQGMRYTCLVRGNPVNLFYEEDRFFMEGQADWDEE